MCPQEYLWLWKENKLWWQGQWFSVLIQPSGHLNRLKKANFSNWHWKLVQLKTCPCPGKRCPWNEPVRKVIYRLWQVKSNSSWLGTSRAFRRGSTVSARICRKILEPVPVNFAHNRECPTRKPCTFWTLYPHQIFPGWVECITQIIQTSGAKTDLMVLRHFDVLCLNSVLGEEYCSLLPHFLCGKNRSSLIPSCSNEKL